MKRVNYEGKIKNNEICVLVTSSGSLSTPSVITCLRNNYEGRNIRIICSDIIDQPIMHHKSDGFFLLPHGNSKSYIAALLRICKREKIKVILPCSGSEAFSIAQNLKLIKTRKIFPAVSSFSSIKKTLDKTHVFKILAKNNIPVPEFYGVKTKNEFIKSIKSLGYPRKSVCFKPSAYVSSGGARGFRILRKNNSIGNLIFDQNSISNELGEIILDKKPGSLEIDLETTLRLFEARNFTKLLVMEYLPSDEYAVYVFANKGKMNYCIPILRKRKELGFTFDAVIKKNNELTKLCRKITKIFDFDYNVQIEFGISREGKPKVIEINPRIAGAISLTMAGGINLPYLAVKKALGEKIPRLKIRNNTKMIRYWKEFYVQDQNVFEFS